MDDLVRIYSLAVAVLVVIVGTAQIRRWPGFDPQERLHWLATALLNLSALVGTWEGLRAGYPGGLRVYLLALAVTWLLAAVSYRPITDWRRRREVAP